MLTNPARALRKWRMTFKRLAATVRHFSGLSLSVRDLLLSCETCYKANHPFPHRLKYPPCLVTQVFIYRWNANSIIVEVVRLYGTDCNQISNVIAATHSSVKLLLGIFDINSIQSEVQIISSVWPIFMFLQTVLPASQDMF